MMRTIRLTRTIHRGTDCIVFNIENDDQFRNMIRTYPGRKWSDSMKRWYIPDREESLKEILTYFRGRYKFDTTELHDGIKKDLQAGGDQIDPHSSAGDDRVELRSGYGPVSFTNNLTTGRLIIKFEGLYDQKWIDEIKQYGRPWYDSGRREWSLYSSRAITDSLSDYFTSRGIKVIVKKAKQPESLKNERDTKGSDIREKELNSESREAVNLLLSYLRKMRYSTNTIGSYKAQLEFFFKYFNSKTPGEITLEDISMFTDEYIISLNYSASHQNQLISAIKTYYMISGGSQFELDEIKRPRKSRPLPQVFSKEEVSKILNATRNLKHRLVLWLIYSCGLRRGEVINIKISDLNRERGLLHIRGGKGDVDRVVPVSDKVWVKLGEYLAVYSPVTYLFEGQTGGKYSAGSVYNIFKQALRRVGIMKDVGVHSLRHSYATHLHESGLDIRYIQELLGHKSSKTTEIYTHVSRRALLNIKSPIDDLDLH
jgi:integrase/recombinase XerD